MLTKGDFNTPSKRVKLGPPKNDLELAVSFLATSAAFTDSFENGANFL